MDIFGGYYSVYHNATPAFLPFHDENTIIFHDSFHRITVRTNMLMDIEVSLQIVSIEL